MTNRYMYRLYEEYEDSLSALKKAVRKLQDKNSVLREKARNTGEDYIFNKNMIDITLMNEMMRDLIYSIEKIEPYLCYEDRKYLHRKAKNISNEILSQHHLYGLVPDGEIEYSGQLDNVESVICNVELQEEIVDLLDGVLAERQKQVVHLFFWEGMTQEKIGMKLGIDKSNVSRTLQNALTTLRKAIDFDEIVDFLR